MKATIATTASALLLCTGMAMAQQAMHEGHKDRLDTNNSGAVNREEYQAFMTEAFDKLDTDGDGNLRAADVGQVLSAEQFTSMDSDGNGLVSRTEFMNRVMADFAQADKSGDGRLE